RGFGQRLAWGFNMASRRRSSNEAPSRGLNGRKSRKEHRFGAEIFISSAPSVGTFCLQLCHHGGTEDGETDGQLERRQTRRTERAGGRGFREYGEALRARRRRDEGRVRQSRRALRARRRRDEGRIRQSRRALRARRR